MKRAAAIPAMAVALAAFLASACQGRAGATPASTEPVSAAAAVPAVAQIPLDHPSPSLPPPGVAPDSTVVLNTGMSADIAPGATLTFESIVSDSRCPKDVQCVWAGEVTIALKLVTPLGSKSFELSERNNRQAALSHVVELVSYGPCPGGPTLTPLSGECAALKVSADPVP